MILISPRPCSIIEPAQLLVFSNFLSTLGQWNVVQFFIASLFFWILIIDLVLIISFIVAIPLILTSRIFLLKHLDRLLSIMSHLNFVWKWALLQWWGSIFHIFTCTWGHPIQHIHGLLICRDIGCLGTIPHLIFKAFPLWVFFLKFVWRC